MSRHKLVKTLDLDAELDDFDGVEESGDEYDPNEDIRMKAALTDAREVLDSNFTDKEIQESLWYYYYDVEKTVNYLLNKKAKESQPKQSKVTPKKTNDPYKLKGLQSQSRSFCSRPLTVKEYFADCPWLNVPRDKRAEILIEPLYPRGGLLGGSSKNGGKTSKLAALAAARKQKAGEQASVGDKVSSSSVVLLDKLGKSKSSDFNDPASKTEAAESQMRATSQRLRKYPLKRHHSSDPKSQPIEEPLPDTSLTPQPDELPQEDDPIVMHSSPSAFAEAIIGESHNTQNAPALSTSYNPFYLECKINEFSTDPFAGPSPDDVVAKAQSASKGLKSKEQSKDSASNNVNGVAKDLGNASLVESRPPKSKNLNVLEEYNKSRRKNAVNFVVIGHVDAGKSTLMGRLLYDLKVVDQRTIDRYKREAEKIGKSSFALAWVLDEGTDEREHGVTIDIAMNKFETEKTAFTILDAPGHKDFVPNMIAGASQADFAILVIDASTGSFESGLKGQTKEHALLVRSMGVQRLIAIVNKLDAVSWSKSRFDEIAQQTSAFLTAAGFQPKNISFVPCSGLKGDNIISSSDKCTWYNGPTLLAFLESSEPSAQNRALSGPLRLPISQVFSAGTQHPLSVAGRITSGSVQVGDQIIIVPGGQTGYVKALSVDDDPAEWAIAGQNTTLHLSAEIDAKLIKGGDLVCPASAPAPLWTSLTLKVLAFEHIMPMYCSIVVGRMNIPGRVTKLFAVLDKTTGKPVAGKGKKPRIIKPGEAAKIEVAVELEGGAPLEEGARVVLRAEGETVGTGIVEAVK